MNKYKGEIVVNQVGFRFSMNARYKFCEMRGIEFSEIEKAINKDYIAGLRDLYLAAHLEYCRFYKEDANITAKEDMMDFIETIEQEDLEAISDTLLKSSELKKEDKKEGVEVEKK